MTLNYLVLNLDDFKLPSIVLQFFNQARVFESSGWRQNYTGSWHFRAFFQNCSCRQQQGDAENILLAQTFQTNLNLYNSPSGTVSWIVADNSRRDLLVHRQVKNMVGIFVLLIPALTEERDLKIDIFICGFFGSFV